MNRPELVIIAAISERDRAMGYQGKLPWSIPADLRHFRDLTLGHAVVLGRKTWELDLQKRALRQRRNIVLTSQTEHNKWLEVQANLDPETELLFTQSLEAAIALAAPHTQLFIAGGASVYSQALPLADRLELTLVEGSFDADTFFPDYQQLLNQAFIQTRIERYPGYRFETYQRQNAG